MEEIIATFSNYTIYKYTSNVTGSYYLCKPLSNVLEYNLFLGLPSRDFTEISQNEIIDDIKKVADAVISANNNGLYLLPIIPYQELVEASNENDFKADKFGNINYNNSPYAKIYENRIKPITGDVYTKLNNKINRKIRLIKNNKPDRMFIHWLVMDYTSKYGVITKELLEEVEYRDLINTNTQKQVITNIPPTSTETSAGGIAPVNHQFDHIDTMSKPYTKTLKTKNGSFGFSNINFIIITLILSLILGINISLLLIK